MDGFEMTVDVEHLGYRGAELLDGGFGAAFEVEDVLVHARCAFGRAVGLLLPGHLLHLRGGHHALEPTVVLAVAAASTTRLRLMTNLYIITYRNPFLAAKAIASLDSLAEGRVILGTGAGYLESEFRALGADFDARNDRLDESLELMK